MLIKKFLTNFRRYYHQGILINRLMKIYSTLIVLFFIFSTMLLSVLTINFQGQTKSKEITRTLENTVRNLESQNFVTLRVMEQLIGRKDDYQNLYDFMTLSQSQYFNRVIDDWQDGRNTVPFSDQIERMFDLYPEIKSIVISLDDSNYYLLADSARKTGQLKTGKLTFLKGNYLTRPILNPDTREFSGSLYIQFKIPEKESNLKEDAYISTVTFDNYGRKLYHQGKELPKDLISKIATQIKKGGRIDPAKISKDKEIYYSDSDHLLALSVVDKSYFLKKIYTIIFCYLLISGFLSWLLLKLFFSLFGNYINQVSEITSTLDKVAAGDLSLKIDNDNMELELYNISHGINQMLDNINQKIAEIYSLEVKQRDAHMQALQAQINPHFLYNTLEYIRMYALSCQEEELADVIYAFASLLRNNISSDKTTSLKEELAFCEKYIYLYQMRYPQSFAYHVVIDDSIANFVVPKFIIQPLVENYFVHGIDYERYNNALSIKALDKEDHICLLITDNGRGCSKEKMEELMANMSNSHLNSERSIGLSNVYLRLITYFKDRVLWEISQSSQGGFQVMIKIRKES
ncbi:sensor histidine kinase [Streptococcus catagoni]|uniref:sensor histidine kinase n=1 Tax=Streptococcus catagoni TaxID=2654874 RepID=UPI00140D1790|nr:sensor histidine kinase [Streptococcus catagoni]